HGGGRVIGLVHVCSSQVIATNQPRTVRGKLQTKQNLQRRAANPSKPGGEIHAAARAGRRTEAPAYAFVPCAPPPSLPRSPRPRIWEGSVSIHDGAAGVGGVGGAGVGGGVAAGGVQPGDAPAGPCPRAHLLRAAAPPRAGRVLPLHPLPPRPRPRPLPPPDSPQPRVPRPPASGARAAPLNLLLQLLVLFLVFGG
ncbi:unnamed protein product, partial [Urochloa humidicola]